MTARIPTRSRRQAMAWSLALISQGIESAIEYSPEGGWGLILANEDFASGMETLNRYQVENRHWPWREKHRQDLLFDWGCLAWISLLALFFWMENQNVNFRSTGLMDSAAVSRGEWWRLFTAVCLHADLGHFAMNASLGLLLLGLTMGRYGAGVGLLASYLAGAGGNVGTWLMFSEHRSLGASGMVMGCVGLLAAQAVSFRAPRHTWKFAVSGFFGGVMLFVLLGLSPGSDVLAHFGGFIAGLLLGSFLLPTKPLAQNHAANLFAGALCVLLVVLPWWVALLGSR